MNNSPVPFIQVDPTSRQLVVSDQGRMVLSSIKGTVGVCAVAGVYRTGKSYILNQLAGHDSGFGVGSSVQACTKGIWLWGAPIQNKTSTPGAPEYVLLLDTEGLQSLSQTEGHDAKIFCLAILLSSFFIYNSEKAINSAALDQLSLVAQLTKKIKLHAAGDQDPSQLSEVFPSFLWLLRDFQLDLTDETGAPISASAYLEEALRPQPGASAAVAEQNTTRAAIASLFPRRACVPLRHPTVGTSLPDTALKNLPGIDQLHPAFRDGVLGLKKAVFGGIQAKAFGGAPATGPMLLSLAEAYVSSINAGALPTISTAWQSVLIIEAQKATEAALSHFRAKTRAAAAADPIPREAAWAAEVAAARDEALAIFRKQALGASTAEHEAKLAAAMAEECQAAEALMAARSEAMCSQLAASLSSRLATQAQSSPPSDLPAALASILREYLSLSRGPARDAGLDQLANAVSSAVNTALSRLSAEAERGAAAAAAAAERAAAAAAAALQAAQAEGAAAAGRAAAAEERAAAAHSAAREREGAAAERLAGAHAQLTAAQGELGKNSTALAQAQAELTAARADAARNSTELAKNSEALAEAQAQLASLRAVQARADTEAAGALRRAEAAEAARAAAEARASVTAESHRSSDALLAAARTESARHQSAAAAATADLDNTRRSFQLEQQESKRLAAQLAAKAQRLTVVEALLAAAPPPPPPAADPPSVGAKRSRSSAGLGAVEEGGGEEAPAGGEEPSPTAGSSSRRSSVLDPSALSVPVLQSKLRAVLGKDAKLPKKKNELIELARKHAITG